MQITRIEIRDFRNIEHLVLDDLSPTLALFGMNGQCKTSVMLALQMLLFGWCPLTTRSGQGAGLLVRDGAKEAVISADVFVRGADPETVRLTCTLVRRGQNEWTAIDPDTGEICFENRDQLWTFAGINERHAMVAAMPQVFLESKELGGILAELLTGDVDPGVVRETILDHARQYLADQLKGAGTSMAESLAQEYVAWLTRFAEAAGLNIERSGDLESLGAKAFDYRRDLKRDLKAHQIELDNMGFVPDAIDHKKKVRTVAELPTIRGKVQSLEACEKNLFEEKGRAESAISADDVAARRTAIQVELDEARERANEAQNCIEQVKATVAAAEAAVDTAKSNETNACMTRNQANHDQAVRARDLATLNTPDGKCPTCKRAYSGKDRATLLAPLEREEKRAQAALDEALTELEVKLDELGRARKQHTKAISKLEDAEHIQRDASGKVSAIEARLAAVPEAYDGRPLDAVVAELVKTQESISRGKTLTEVLEKIDARDSMQRYIEITNAEIARLNWAVKAFRDGEVTKQFMRDGLADFTSRANIELEPFGYSLDVAVVGKAVDVMLLCPGAATARPVSHCSGGQKMLAQYAVALAFSETGAPVFLDNINELDGAHRKRMLGRLREMPESTTVLVAAAWQQGNTDMGPIAQALAPVTVAWAEDGQVTVTRTGAKVVT